MISITFQLFLSLFLATACFSKTLPTTANLVCHKLLPERLATCVPETSESPYIFVAECRKDWSYCIVKLDAPTQSSAFREAYISAEALHCEDGKGKLMGHFKNAWPGSDGYYERHNYFCGAMNRNYKGRKAFNLFNPVSVASSGDLISPILKSQFTWKKIVEREDLTADDQEVVFKATVVQNGKKFWTGLKATVIRLLE